MRIVFFGTPAFAVPSLRALLAGDHTVVGVVCQPDRPAGRGQRLSSPPVKVSAEAANVPVSQPEKIRTPAFAEVLSAWSPDLIVVVAYGKILPQQVLDLPPQGCINVHASLLPRYRGAAPIQWAILNGEAATGVTIMRINERMDAGDILLQRATDIGREETYGELQERLALMGAELLSTAIESLCLGHLVARVQDEAQATHAPLIRKEDGRIDWARPADEIARQVRAFNPWPSAFTFFAGQRIKIHRARAVAGSSATPGTVLAAGQTIRVATARGVLEIDDLQVEGRKKLSAAELARGGTLPVGSILDARVTP